MAQVLIQPGVYRPIFLIQRMSPDETYELDAVFFCFTHAQRYVVDAIAGWENA